ncbi:hypothetical protein BU15DRAFT_78912 [Melanogaster broomeanus]|nr:hypothetical protein BU15DRAFT_78912 [Melanogaster broomeanus]
MTQGSVGSLIFIFFRFMPSVTFGEPPLPIVSGCYMTGASPILFASFVVIMLVEAGAAIDVLLRIPPPPLIPILSDYLAHVVPFLPTFPERAKHPEPELGTRWRILLLEYVWSNTRRSSLREFFAPTPTSAANPPRSQIPNSDAHYPRDADATSPPQGRLVLTPRGPALKRICPADVIQASGSSL